MSELFWVKEKSNGGLTLMLKSSPDVLPGNLIATATPNVSQKYSIHRSNGGIDTTVHQTLVLGDGTEIDTAAFLHKSADTLLFPLFARACPDISLPRYKPNNPRNSDSIIVAARLGNVCTTLVYCVVIGSNKLPVPPSVPPIVVSTARFKRFDVTVLCGHSMLPACTIGTMQHFMTNSPKLNGSFVGPDLRDQPLEAAMDHDQSAMSIVDLMTILSQKHAERVFASGDLLALTTASVFPWPIYALTDFSQ